MSQITEAVWLTGDPSPRPRLLSPGRRSSSRLPPGPPWFCPLTVFGETLTLAPAQNPPGAPQCTLKKIQTFLLGFPARRNPAGRTRSLLLPRFLQDSEQDPCTCCPLHPQCLPRSLLGWLPPPQMPPPPGGFSDCPHQGSASPIMALPTPLRFYCFCLFVLRCPAFFKRLDCFVSCLSWSLECFSDLFTAVRPGEGAV